MKKLNPLDPRAMAEALSRGEVPTAPADLGIHIGPMSRPEISDCNFTFTRFLSTVELAEIAKRRGVRYEPNAAGEGSADD